MIKGPGAAAAQRFKYLARWKNALLAKVYLAWVAYAKKETGTRARMKAITVRMARRTEVLVIQEWHRYVVEARATMSKAASRWAQSGVYRGFLQLQAHAEEQLRLRRLASKLLGAYLHGLAFRVFGAWTETIAHALTYRPVFSIDFRNEFPIRSRHCYTLS